MQNRTLMHYMSKARVVPNYATRKSHLVTARSPE
jgi:hypothetical protein